MNNYLVERSEMEKVANSRATEVKWKYYSTLVARVLLTIRCYSFLNTPIILALFYPVDKLLLNT